MSYKDKAFSEFDKSETDNTNGNNMKRDESMLLLESQLSYQTTTNNITQLQRNPETIKYQEALDISDHMNELIENNNLNLIAIQKVLNTLIINLGRSLVENVDLHKTIKRYREIGDESSDSFSDEFDVDRYTNSQEKDKVDFLKPIKVNKLDSITKKNSVRKSSKSKESAKKISQNRMDSKPLSNRSDIEKEKEKEDKNEIDENQHLFGTTFNSKGFGNFNESQKFDENNSRVSNGNGSRSRRVSNIKNEEQASTMRKEELQLRRSKKESKLTKDKDTKDKLKAEILAELRTILDGIDHTQMYVQQVQKIPDASSKENLKEELSELKSHFSKIAEKDKEVDKKMSDLENRTNKMHIDVGNLKTDQHKMALKDEVSHISASIPSLATKEDIEVIIEKLKDKVDQNLVSDFRIKVDNLTENQRMYVPQSQQIEKIKDIEDMYKSVRDSKVDAKYVDGKDNDIILLYDDKFRDFYDFKERINERIDSIQKQFSKFEKSIENKAHKDQIWELKELIRGFVTKEALVEMEEKVFPLMGEVVEKIQSFQSVVDESARSMVRFDELITDKASKHDLKKIDKQLEKCLDIETFDILKREFDGFSKTSSAKIENFELTLKAQQDVLDESKTKFYEVSKSIRAVTELNMDFLKRDDLHDVQEILDTKSDKLDLAKLNSVKSNKADINMLLKCIDTVHSQVKQLSNFNISQVRVLNQSMHGEPDKSEQSRNMLMNNALSFKQKMEAFKLGDIATGDQTEDKKNDHMIEVIPNLNLHDETGDRKNNSHQSHSQFINEKKRKSDSQNELRQSMNASPLKVMSRNMYKDDGSMNKNKNKKLVGSSSFVLPNINIHK